MWYENTIFIFAMICFGFMAASLIVMGIASFINQNIHLPDATKSVAVVAAVKTKVNLPLHPVNLFDPPGLPGFPAPVYHHQYNHHHGYPIYST